MRVKTALTISAVLLGLVVGAIPAMAAQSFFGYSGLVNTPTTEVMGMGEFSIGGYFTNFDIGPNVTTFVGSAGVFPGLEVAAGVSTPEDGDSEPVLSAKFRFMADTLVTPSLAVGVFDMGDNFDTSAYIVAGKALSVPGTEGSLASAAVYIGGAVGDFEGLFGGVTVGVGDKLTLMAEYDTDDVNFGARLAIADQLRLHGALLGGDTFGVGLSFYTGF